MHVKHLDNFRMTAVYSPKVLKIIRDHYSARPIDYSESVAEQICDSAKIWAKIERSESGRREILTPAPHTTGNTAP